MGSRALSMRTGERDPAGKPGEGLGGGLPATAASPPGDLGGRRADGEARGERPKLEGEELAGDAAGWTG